ncbi:MAG: repeat protein [Labilithrix sp.]|nr:repeat protein [Labilithrix sp.]
MQESVDLEKLFATWQRNPDVAQTIAMCHALRGSARADLVEIVGSYASRQLDASALSAAARMYIGTGRLDDAQQVLIAAGRLAPRDGEVFVLLGEVLLRRGDAERAEKVLERALQFGATNDAARWLERARALVPTQQSSGMMAVADEIARFPRSPDEARQGEQRRHVPAAAPPPRRDLDDDIETQVRSSADVKAALLAGRDPFAQHPPQTGANEAPALLRSIEERAAVGAGTMPFSSRGGASAGSSEPPPASVGEHGPGLGARHGANLPALPQEPPVNPFLAPPRAPRPISASGQPMPEARDVLDALQIAGVFEPDGAVRAQVFGWARPERGKRRIGSYALLGGLAALIVGGAFGAFTYVNTSRAKAHVEAENVLANVDASLRASDAKLLDGAEQQLGRSFELESRSPHAALTWLHERVALGLLKSGESVAFEDSTNRAKDVGVPEKNVAFAYVASFLFQGDTAGAASTIAKWDGKADDDAWYQIVAGATFERAGDARAIERYQAAVKLDPELVLGQILLARATAVDGDPRRAGELAKEFRARHPDRLEGVALTAVAWARDPLRGEPIAEARDIADKQDALPLPLQAVAPACRALLAIEQHKNDEAVAALTRGLAVSDTPGVASWLGSIALMMGNEALARKGALTAVSYSAVYPPARVLAARVALLGARLDEALKATEELPQSSPDVAIVAAVVAYEKLDGDRMKSAIENLAEDTRRLPFLVPLVRGQQLLAGNPQALAGDKALDMADDEGPWADIVAMDSALDLGDLDLAHKIAAKWTGDAKPIRAVRLARLARWDGKNEDADRLSKLALDSGTVTVRGLAERVYTLVALNRSTEAIALFKTYPNVGGPLAKWLRAYAVAAHGKVDEARAILSQEDPPPALAPLPARLIAASGYGAVKDTRKGADYVKALGAFANPDLVTAAEKVGAARLAKKR